MQFQKVDGSKIDNVLTYIEWWVRSKNGDDCKIWVGVDSLPKRWARANFVEVIALYHVGHGAHIIFHREKNVRIFGHKKMELMKDRLMKEAFRLVEVCQYLREAGMEDLPHVLGPIEPQLDYNKEKKWASERVLDWARNYVKSCGFDVQVKPDAPAASYAADMVCREKEHPSKRRKV
jgi:predicted RNase H-related nuclease YkuK (DUF458 family)